MYIKRSIKFLLHTRKKGDSQSGKNLAIRMRITYGGNIPLDFPTGQSIDAKDWDVEKECAIDGVKNKSGQTNVDINRTIDEYRSFVNEIFARYELLDKRIPTTGEVKDLFNDMIGKKPKFIEEAISVEEAFNEYIDNVGKQNNWTNGTYKKMRTIKSHFMNANKNITFEKITNETLQEFIFYLMKKGLRNTTISKDYSLVRWFLRWAYNSEYYKGNAHNTFKPRLKGVDGSQSEIIYLSLSELNQVRDCKIPISKKYLEQVRDVFLFCCYTSLRYSDVAVLKKDDIKNNCIHIVTQKTTDGLIIELNKRAKDILDKYKDNKFKNGLLLPVISNQKTNAYLKELGQLSELNEITRVVYFKGNIRHDECFPKWALLTTHVARRTFVVTALQLGIPTEVIIRWTGHADYKAMKPYVAIVDELKKKEMSKFDSI